jgi:hypothetical protein
MMHWDLSGQKALKMVKRSLTSVGRSRLRQKGGGRHTFRVMTRSRASFADAILSCAPTRPRSGYAVRCRGAEPDDVGSWFQSTATFGKEEFRIFHQKH